MGAVLFSLIFVVLLFSIKYLPFFKNTGLNKYCLEGLFILKLIAGASLIILYKNYYDTSKADIFNYYNDGYELYKLSKINFTEFLKTLFGIGEQSQQTIEYLHNNTNFWYKAFNYGLLNDNRLIIRINAVISFISMHNIGVHLLIFSFLSFTGSVYLYKLFNMFSSNKLTNLISSFLIPSELIWSSSLLKEAVLMLGVGVFTYYLFLLYKKGYSINRIIGLILGFIILFLLKIYVLLSIAPAVLFLILLKIYKKNIFVVWGASMALFIIMFFASPYISHYNLPQIASNKQHDFINMINASGNVGSKINIPVLHADILSFIKNTPVAIFNVLFRPNITDVHSIIVLPAVVENIFLLLMFVFLIIRFNKENFIKNIVFNLFIITFIMFLATIIGLTTPVLGSIVRYKVPFLPFLYFFVLNTVVPYKSYKVGFCYGFNILLFSVLCLCM